MTPEPVATELFALRVPTAVGVLLALLMWESAQPFFAFFGGESGVGARLRHALSNISFGVVNGLVIRVVFVALWARVIDWTAARELGLLHRLSLPAWLHAIVAILLLDLWTYVWHRANHVLPVLWRFHRLHHADREMDVTTANRFHLAEITLSSLARVPVFIVFGCTLADLARYEVLLFAVVQFHHANIGLPPWLDRILRTVIVTPHLHKVHHSVVPREQNSNYSSLFSWWDRLARTLHVVPDPALLTFGVDEDRATSRLTDR